MKKSVWIVMVNVFDFDVFEPKFCLSNGVLMSFAVLWYLQLCRTTKFRSLSHGKWLMLPFQQMLLIYLLLCTLRAISSDKCDLACCCLWCRACGYIPNKVKPKKTKEVIKAIYPSVLSPQRSENKPTFFKTGIF